MKLLVLGATGATGLQIVEQAIAQGHQVTAFVRDPVKLGTSHPALLVVQGSMPDDAAALAGALKGQDAVLSSLGMRNALRSNGLQQRSMQALVPAMEKAGVRRLITVSANGVGDSYAASPLLSRLMYRLLLGDIFADKKAGEDVVRASSLDWTFAYPTLLTNGPRTGKYRAGERLELSGVPKISRADVADFVLKQLQGRSWSRKRPVISY